MDHEFELKRDEVRITIMYGIIWLFLATLISGIPMLNKEFNLLYIAISVFLLIVGIKKLIKGRRRLTELKKRKIKNYEN